MVLLTNLLKIIGSTLTILMVVAVLTATFLGSVIQPMVGTVASFVMHQLLPGRAPVAEQVADLPPPQIEINTPDPTSAPSLPTLVENLPLPTEQIFVESEPVKRLELPVKDAEEMPADPIKKIGQEAESGQPAYAIYSPQDRTFPSLIRDFFSNELVQESAEIPSPRFALPGANVETNVKQIPIVEGRWDLTDLDADVGILAGAGRFPGDSHSMVFAGHVTTRWPILGPFGRLKTFSLGDEVVYSDGKSVYTYEISRFIYAHPSRVDLLFQQRGDQIVLVTCNGYDLFTDTFDQRLVSYATLVEVRPFNSTEFQSLIDS